MPQETKQQFESHVAIAQGSVISSANPEALRRALDEAFDYRGDITLHLRDGRTIDGYLFDRRSGSTLESSTVRLIESRSTASGGEEKTTVAYSDIASLTFSGKDTAAGKTWENWLRRYAEKKLKGEAADIESESLE